MSNNELRAQYRTFEGRAKQGFVSPVGEVDEQQLKEMIAGYGVKLESTLFGVDPTLNTCREQCPGQIPTWSTQQCARTYRPDDMPFC